MNKTYNYDLINAVLAELRLSACATYILSANEANGLFELELVSEGMRYDCYVDLDSLEVVGINAEPILEEEVLEAMYCPELLSSLISIAA